MVGIRLFLFLFIMQVFLYANNVVNYGLRGQNHPVTEVQFNRLGFPIFESYFNCKLPFHMINNTDSKQFSYCTNKLREAIKNNPKLKAQFTEKQLKDINKKNAIITDSTWHHHQAKSKRLLQLVNRELHNRTGHSGGRSVYGGGKLGRLGKLSKLYEANAISYNENIKSMKDYQKVAKNIDKSAIAVPAILTKDNKVIMSIKSGAYSGLAVITIDGLQSYYDFINGNIYSNEFEKEIINSSIKATSVSAVESLIMFIIPSPHGLVILGAGVGTYILVDKVLDRYKYYKEKHFLSADDLKVYEIKLDSILNINDTNVPLNINKW